MLGEIAWAIVCFGCGWAARSKFGTLGEMKAAAVAAYKKIVS